MKTTCMLSWFAIAGVAGAQTLAPELAPLAAKYKTDVAALDAQRTAAMTQAQSAYLTALASAEATATRANNVAGVAAINSEKNAINSGLMAPAFPPGLPKELQRPRKTFVDARDRIRSAEAPRRQAIDGAYLRALAALEAKAATNPVLAQQLKSEKQQLLANAPADARAPGGSSKPNGKNAVVNGTFDLTGAEGGPSGWTHDAAFKIARDGSNKVLHAAATDAGYRHITQDITLPARARNVTLSGRVRGKMTARNTKEPHWGANIGAVFIDGEGRDTTTWMMLDGGNDRGWKPMSTTVKAPEGAKSLRVVLMLKHVSGEFDFDDVQVEAR